MEFKLIQQAQDEIKVINACVDTCNNIVSAPMNNRTLVDILKKIDNMDGQNVVIGIPRGVFELHENKQTNRIELWITKGTLKICKVVF
jgi:hypothetical protein